MKPPDTPYLTLQWARLRHRRAERAVAAAQRALGEARNTLAKAQSRYELAALQGGQELRG